MATIRSPKGLALTVLAALTVIVLWINIYSAPMTLRGLEAYDYARWLRSPLLPLVVSVIGLGIWIVLAALSYAFRLRPWMVALVFVLAARIGTASYLTATSYWWASTTFESATWIGPIPDGVLGTTWRGITGGACLQFNITELSIAEDGTVSERNWGDDMSILFPAIHFLRAVPDADPWLTRTGHLSNGVIYWDFDGDKPSYESEKPHIARRSGRQLVLEVAPDIPLVAEKEERASHKSTLNLSNVSSASRQLETTSSTRVGGGPPQRSRTRRSS